MNERNLAFKVKKSHIQNRIFFPSIRFIWTVIFLSKVPVEAGMRQTLQRCFRQYYTQNTFGPLRKGLLTSAVIHTDTPRTHWLSCFQRWKKSCDAISVGWKNLLMVTGSLRVRFCKAPPYLMEQKTHLEIHSTQSYQVTGGYLVTAQQVTTCGSVCSTAELKRH